MLNFVMASGVAMNIIQLIVILPHQVCCVIKCFNKLAHL
jgi:hypothetical protein